MKSHILAIVLAFGLVSVGLTVVITTNTFPAPQTRVLSENNTSPDPDSGVEEIIPPEISESLLALAIHESVNQVRMNNGLQPLQWDPKIAQVAKAHSDDMMKNGYFSHYALDGEGPDKRGIAAGYVTCGDPSTIELEKEYYDQEAKHNTKVRALNEQTARYNDMVRQYEKDASYYRNFRSDDAVLLQAINKRQHELELESKRIDAESAILNAEAKEMKNKLDVLNTNAKEMKVSKGFGENLELNYLYDSYTNLGSTIQYDWKPQGQIVNSTINDWVSSLEHNENMNDYIWVKSGIGVTIDPIDYEVYITQDFC